MHVFSLISTRMHAFLCWRVDSTRMHVFLCWRADSTRMHVFSKNRLECALVSIKSGPWLNLHFTTLASMFSSVSSWLPAPRVQCVPYRLSPSFEGPGAFSALGYSETSPSFSPSPLLGGGVPAPLPSMVRSAHRLVDFKQVQSPADSPLPISSSLRWGSPAPHQMAPRPVVEASRKILTRSKAALALHDSVRQTRSASRGVVKPNGRVGARSKKAVSRGIDLFCYESL